MSERVYMHVVQTVSAQSRITTIVTTAMDEAALDGLIHRHTDRLKKLVADLSEATQNNNEEHQQLMATTKRSSSPKTAAKKQAGRAANATGRASGNTGKAAGRKTASTRKQPKST